MIYLNGTYLLWALAIALIVIAILNWPDRDRPHRSSPFTVGRWPGIGFILGAALFMLLLTSCAAPTVISTPNSCATLLPQEWKQGVAGAALPSGDTVGDWVAFGDAQTGKLDMANDRTTDAIGIIERCETRDAASVKKATRRWWQIL